MDIRMPGSDGLEAVRSIAADPDLATVRVITLTTFDLDDHVYAALRAGAAGFLVKDTEPAEVIHAVRVAVRGGAFTSAWITNTTWWFLATTVSEQAARRSRPPLEKHVVRRHRRRAREAGLEPRERPLRSPQPRHRILLMTRHPEESGIDEDPQREGTAASNSPFREYGS